MTFPAVAPAHRVVVGVDGSVSARAALRTAHDAAARLEAQLVVVTSFRFPPTYGRFPLYVSDLRRLTEQAQRAAVADVLGESERDAVAFLVESGAPAQVLIDASAGADLLVLGSRGHGGFAGLLLGSVGMACIAHAPCPVLIVHEPAGSEDERQARPVGRIVVGVDPDAGSPHAIAAAREAARATGGSVDAVATWQVPPAWGGVAFDLDAELAAPTEQALEHAIGAAVAGTDIPVSTSVQMGAPSAVLVKESEHADLLVVGRRRGSETIGTFAGATALVCAAHAHCPVLVVPEDAADFRARPS